MEGEEKSSGLPLTLLWAGSEINRHHLVELAFKEGARHERIGQVWLWNVGRIAAAVQPTCPLLCVEVRQRNRHLLRVGNYFHVPCWISGEVTLPLPPETLKNEALRSDLRKIQKHGLEYEITRDPQHFDDFYHRMYLPHVTRTHGRDAVVVPYERKRAEFQNCDLLFVKKQGQAIAGILLVHESPCLRIWSLGVRDGDMAWVKEGAVAALFHFSFEHAHAAGFTRVRLGYSRPFLKDGVLQYKRKLSQRLAEGGEDGMAVQIRARTPGTEAFLRHNPFVFQTDEGLQGAIFTGSDSTMSEADRLKLEKDFWHQGLTRLVVYRLGSDSAPAPGTPIPEAAGRLTFRHVVKPAELVPPR